ncbi:MAG: copper chaperone PCu(A)C [Pseudomonadota bacterium]
MPPRCRLPALLALAFVAAAGCSRPPALAVTDAWVRPLPPGQHMTAGYLRVRFNGAAGESARLTGVESPLFGAIELHETRLVDGVNRMRPVAGVTLGAGETVEFAPGGLHLMLMRPSDTARGATEIPLVLHFDGRDSVRVQALVGQRGPDGG